MAHRFEDEPGRPRGRVDKACDNAPHYSPARSLYFLLGWCFFGLGAVGAVVPGLPTTAFMLLALWAFAKCSRRFHDWLYFHPTFGPPLQQWCAHHVIPLKAKLLSVTMMSLSFIYIHFFTAMNGWIQLLIALVMLYGAAFILSKPSRTPDQDPT